MDFDQLVTWKVERSVFSKQCAIFLFLYILFHLYGIKGGKVGVSVDRSDAWFLSNVFNSLKLCLSSSKTTYFMSLLASSVWFEKLAEKLSDCNGGSGFLGRGRVKPNVIRIGWIYKRAKVVHTYSG